MTHDDIRLTLSTDPGLRLLRSDNAPLVIGFLYEQFKAKPRVTATHTELIGRLEDHLFVLRAAAPEAYPSSAAAYLSTWCDQDHQILRRYFETGSDDPRYELTPAAERVIGWIEALDRPEFIGTESRFLQIFNLLEEVVRRSTEDPEARLAQLEKQKAALDAEVEAIRRTGRVERYNSTQIKERFLRASEEARRLLADFREVEANFRGVTRRVQERRLLEEATKGDIVGYVIDADDALKESDQGRSFYAFWRFLISHQGKEELRGLLERVYEVPEVQGLEGDYGLLRHIVRHLSEAGEKIVQTNRRLAEQLRRMLDDGGLRESRRISELIAEVKKTALEIRDAPPDDRAFLELEGRPDINLPMERPLWQPDERPTFQNQAAEVPDNLLDDIDLSGLFDLFAVERDQLEQRVRDVLQSRSQVSLAEMVDLYPVEKGLAEVLAYLSIATEDPRHVVDERTTDRIVMHHPGRAARRVDLPRVIFVRS
jgi:hypothetical protein